MRTQDVIAKMWAIIRNPDSTLTRVQTIKQVGELYEMGTDRILVAIRALPHNSPMVSHLEKDLDALKDERSKILEKLGDRSK